MASSTTLAGCTPGARTPMPDSLRAALCDYLRGEVNRLGMSIDKKETKTALISRTATDKQLLWVFRKFDMCEDKLAFCISGVPFKKYMTPPGYNCLIPRDILSLIDSKTKQLPEPLQQLLAAKAGEKDDELPTPEDIKECIDAYMGNQRAAQVNQQAAAESEEEEEEAAESEEEEAAAESEEEAEPEAAAEPEAEAAAEPEEEEAAAEPEAEEAAAEPEPEAAAEPEPEPEPEAEQPRRSTRSQTRSGSKVVNEKRGPSAKPSPSPKRTRR